MGSDGRPIAFELDKLKIRGGGSSSTLVWVSCKSLQFK